MVQPGAWGAASEPVVPAPLGQVLARLSAATWWRRVPLLLAVAAVALAGGAVLLGGGLADLREAYLYRERTSEGLLFFWVGLRMAVGSALLAAAALLAVVASVLVRRQPALVLRALAGGVGAAIVASWVLVGWVESQTGCIGPCG